MKFDHVSGRQLNGLRVIAVNGDFKTGIVFF